MTVYGAPIIPPRRKWTKKSGPLVRRIMEAYERETADEPRPTPEERREWHNPLCGHCGHFTGWNSDNYTNWGSAYDMEPPDPTYLCARCVAIEIADAMNHRRIVSHWIPAKYEYDVAKLLGFVRNDSHPRWVPAPTGGR